MNIKNNRNNDLNLVLSTQLNYLNIIEPKINIIEKITDCNKKIVNLIYNIEDYSKDKILFKRNNTIKLTKRRNKSLNDNNYDNLKQKISSIYGLISTKEENNCLILFLNLIVQIQIIIIIIVYHFQKLILKVDILVNQLTISIFIVIKEIYIKIKALI